MSDRPEPGPRRRSDASALLFVAGLVVLAAVLASWHSRSISRRYTPAFASERIDVNRAPSAELAELPGIGVALAERIVASRTKSGRFKDIGDLMERIDGLGAQAAAAIAPRVSFGE